MPRNYHTEAKIQPPNEVVRTPKATGTNRRVQEATGRAIYHWREAFVRLCELTAKGHYNFYEKDAPKNLVDGAERKYVHATHTLAERMARNPLLHGISSMELTDTERQIRLVRFLEALQQSECPEMWAPILKQFRDHRKLDILEQTSVETFYSEEEEAPLNTLHARECVVREKVYEVLRTLTSREEDALRFRYGLERAPCTLKNTEKSLHLTRGKLHKVLSKAKRKMQHPVRAQQLPKIADLREDAKR